ncbi:MAG: hypothetical protein WC022_00305 [Parcubacteria group bacterium]
MKNNIIVKMLLAVIFFVITIEYILGDPMSLLSATIYLAAPLVYMASSFYVARLYGHGNKTGEALFFVFLGASFWFLGEVIWYILKFFMHAEPFPSIADVFFLLAYPLFFVAIYKGLGHVKDDWKKIKKSTIIFNVILAIFLTGVVSYWGIYSAYDPELGISENIFAMSYGVGDLFLVFGLLWAVSLVSIYGKGKLGRFWNIMTGGVLLYLVADILFAMFQSEYLGGFQLYGYIDIIWMASYFVLAYGLLENALVVNAIQEKMEKSPLAAENLK